MQSLPTPEVLGTIVPESSFYERCMNTGKTVSVYCNCGGALRMSFMVPSVVALGLPLGRERVAHQYPRHRSSRGRWSTAVPWSSQRSSQVSYESQFGNVYCWVCLGSANNFSRRPATFTRKCVNCSWGPPWSRSPKVCTGYCIHWPDPLPCCLLGSCTVPVAAMDNRDKDGIDASPVASTLSTV
jgi:hypothetical protein